MDANRVKQLELFDESKGKTLTNGSAAFNDTAFASNKSTPVHRWVPWIAGFSREFVQSALERYLGKRGTVLDPFAGVGTTLVEAILAGHHAIGFEINPYAALACHTKLSAYRLDVNMTKGVIDRFQQFYSQAVTADYTPLTKPPVGFRTRGEFYSPRVLHKVLIVHDFIARLEDDALRDLFRVAFAATMVVYSNYSYEPSLGRRASAGKRDVEDFPVGQVIGHKLREMAQDIRWMQAQLNGKSPRAQVFNESFFRSREKMRASTIDLLITSPPYLNNYHYNRNTRPHLYWLGFVNTPRELKRLEEDNFGKYWQTVRQEPCVDLDFEPNDGEIAETLKRLRMKTPEKGVYGGNGWANYAASYFNDCHRFAKAAKYVLKPGARALVVIGNSILQGVMIPTDSYLGKIAESVGLELVDIHISRATRVGSSIIQSDVRVAKAKDSHRLYEAVVELRKR